jgi:hypothetical protein
MEVLPVGLDSAQAGPPLIVGLRQNGLDDVPSRERHEKQCQHQQEEKVRPRDYHESPYA